MLEWLVDETARVAPDRTMMQISTEQGALLGLLVGLVKTGLAIEIGTFTGYSSVCIARALEPGGRLVCLDRDQTWTAVAREAWQRAGISDRIELRLGDAAETLGSLAEELTRDDVGGCVDFAFIDADKSGYLGYYETVLTMMRPNGLICVDNTLWYARVLDDPAHDDIDTAAIRAFNDAVASDARVESWILPIADGLTLIRVR